MKTEANYLGHRIPNKGVTVQQPKVCAVQGFPVPTTVKELRAFLGLVGYFREYFKDFATTANALHQLLRKGQPFEWKADQQKAFEALKRELTTAPVLAHYDQQKNCCCKTDASSVGISAVLAQRDADGKERPVRFASRTLRGAELRYPVREKEALAILFGVENFREFLYGQRFTVETDHESLKYLWTQPIKPDSRMGRMTEVLQKYDFDVRYRQGVANRNADAISRHPNSKTPLSKVEEEMATCEIQEVYSFA